MPPQKRSKKNTSADTNQEDHHKMKTMKSLTFLNLQTSQTRNKEQNLRPSKEQELRRQHTF
jgi:hypothetical protein